MVAGTDRSSTYVHGGGGGSFIPLRGPFFSSLGRG